MENLRLEVRIVDEEGNYRKPIDLFIAERKLNRNAEEYYTINESMYPTLNKQHENISARDVVEALEKLTCYLMRTGDRGMALKLNEVERIYKEGENVRS